MNFTDGIIDKWAEEAVEDLGEKGWRDIDPNSMQLIIYSTQKESFRKLVQKITTPIWWLLGAVGTGIVWLIINHTLQIG